MMAAASFYRQIIPSLLTLAVSYKWLVTGYSIKNGEG